FAVTGKEVSQTAAGLTVLLLFGGVAIGCSIAFWCLDRAYHLGLTPAEELLSKDPREPILYLRSFQDDGKNNLHPTSVVAELFGIRNPSGQRMDPVAKYFLPILKVYFLFFASIRMVVHLFRGIRIRTA